MPGLVPRIHFLVLSAKDVDGRDEPGHNGGEVTPAFRRCPQLMEKFPWPAAPDAPFSGTSNPCPPPAARHCRRPPHTALPPTGGRSWQNPTARGCALVL